MSLESMSPPRPVRSIRTVVSAHINRANYYIRTGLDQFIRSLGFRGLDCACETGPLATPADAAKADIVVRVYDNWIADVRRDIANASPGGDCVFEGVAFVRGPTPKADWHVCLNMIDWHRNFEVFRGRPNRTIFAIAEPASPIHQPWHFGQGEGTIVLTCDDQLDRYEGLPRQFVAFPSAIRSWSINRSHAWLKTNQIQPEAKVKRLSWITSSLALMDGHKARMRFLASLQEKVDFDLFGRGFHEVEDKWDVLAPYRYSLAYENFRAPLLMTEKLMDCFVAETMPIYFGSPTVTNYFPSESMVLIDPDDPDVFRIIADVIASDRWLTNREAVLEAKRIVLDEMNSFLRIARFIKDAEANTVADRKRLMRIKQVPLDYN